MGATPVTVIDSSRNLTNIGTIDCTNITCGNVTPSGEIFLGNAKEINFAKSDGTNDGTKIERFGGNALRFRYTGNSAIFDSLGDHSFQVRNSGDTEVFRVIPNSSVGSSTTDIVNGALRMGSTTIIDVSRNLTNIASIDMTGALTDSAVNRGIKFDSASMKPSNGSGGDADNHIDLGTSSARFKNLHLSGTISSGAITSSGLTVQPAIGAGDALVTVAQTNVNAYVHAGIKINAGNTNPFYIYQSGSSNTLRFNYNSLSDAGGQMVLTDAGRVGIGTASPSHPLHILGTSNDTIDETKGNLKVQGGGGNGLIFGTIASSPYTSYIQSAYVVDTSLAQYNIALNPIGGNVGIGLTNPAKPLHIYAASNQLRIEDSTNGKKYDLNVDSSNFMVDDMSAGVNRFTIANGGNTGVGTSSPSYKFDVYGEDDVTMRIHRPNSGLASTDSCGIGFSQRGDGNTSTTDTRAGIFSNYNGDLFLAVEAAGNLNSNPIDHSALFIEGANARVGIGTTSPSSKLHIEDASSPVVLVRDTTNNCTLQMYAQNSNVHIGTSSNHSLFFDTNNTQRVELTTAGVLNCGNDVAAFGTLSDITLKENIKVIENPLDKVKQIRGVNFSYKKDGRKSTGLIAQELEKVLPNAIFTTNEINDDKEIKAIRYGNVVGLLVEAIKEQQEQIEELKAKLEEVA